MKLKPGRGTLENFSQMDSPIPASDNLVRCLRDNGDRRLKRYITICFCTDSCVTIANPFD